MTNANRRPGSGFLNQNTKKTPGSNQPDITGYFDLEINGQITRMRLAGWAKENDRGKFYSLKISEEQERKPPAPEVPLPSVPNDDDIPF